MSDEGEKNIWDTLGFDVCNTACWTDDAFAHDDSNQYNAYFRNYPYDVLNSIGMDNIGKISVVAISPTINEYVCNTTLNEVILRTAWMYLMLSRSYRMQSILSSRT